MFDFFVSLPSGGQGEFQYLLTIKEGNTVARWGCVLNPLMHILNTHDHVFMQSSNIIICAVDKTLKSLTFFPQVNNSTPY